MKQYLSWEHYIIEFLFVLFLQEQTTIILCVSERKNLHYKALQKICKILALLVMFCWSVTYQKSINHHRDVLVYPVLEAPSNSAKRNAANFRAFLPEITRTCLLSDFQSRPLSCVREETGGTAGDCARTGSSRRWVKCLCTVIKELDYPIGLSPHFVLSYAGLDQIFYAFTYHMPLLKNEAALPYA